MKQETRNQNLPLQSLTASLMAVSLSYGLPAIAVEKPPSVMLKEHVHKAKPDLKKPSVKPSKNSMPPPAPDRHKAKLGGPPLKVTSQKQGVSEHSQGNKPVAAKAPAKVAAKPASTAELAPPVAPDWKSIEELRKKNLSLPLSTGIKIESMKGQFTQGRVGHWHHAVDLIAPRDTPIYAVEDGKIERLFESVAGGLTIYQKDKSGKFVYYYAHLERYDNAIQQGDNVKRGQVIGYVGTSGNAPPNTPHLHFAISTIGPQDSVFKGVPIDPYEVYKTRGQ